MTDLKQLDAWIDETVKEIQRYMDDTHAPFELAAKTVLTARLRAFLIIAQLAWVRNIIKKRNETDQPNKDY